MGHGYFLSGGSGQRRAGETRFPDWVARSRTAVVISGGAQAKAQTEEGLSLGGVCRSGR